MTRVLVIDDDPELRQFLCESLEENGYSAEGEADGALGIRAYQRQPADIVLTDIVMPTKEGLETILEFRRRFPEATIIAMSGGLTAANYDPLPAARILGAQHTLQKPFSVKEMLDLLSQIVSEAGK